LAVEALPPGERLSGPGDPLSQSPRPALGLRAAGDGHFIVPQTEKMEASAHDLRARSARRNDDLLIPNHLEQKKGSLACDAIRLKS
jgi:hypothetical protein